MKAVALNTIHEYRSQISVFVPPISRAGYDVAPWPVIMASRDRSTSETRELPSVRSTLRWMACFVALLPLLAGAADDEAEELWVLKPVVRPDVPAGLTASPNPIDAFIAEGYEAKGLKPVGPADRRTLLRRVYARPDRAPAHARRAGGVPPATSRRTPTRRWSTGSSPASSTASATAGTGSTSCATPTSTSG